MLPEFYNELGAMHGTIMVFLGRGPTRRRRIRELRRPAADWSPGHGVPEAQHGELLVLLPGRRDDARQLLRPRGSRAVGVDLLRAPLGHRGHGPDDVAHRDDLPDHIVTARRHQLHHDDHSAPREGADVHAVPLLRVGPVRHGLPAAHGVPAARGRGGHAADGSRWPARASSCRAASSSAARSSTTPAEATRSSGSTCSGSWRTRRSTS